MLAITILLLVLVGICVVCGAWVYVRTRNIWIVLGTAAMSIFLLIWAFLNMRYVLPAPGQGF